MIIDNKTHEVLTTFFLNDMAEVKSMCLSRDSKNLNVMTQNNLKESSESMLELYVINIESDMYNLEKRLENVSFINPDNEKNSAFALKDNQLIQFNMDANV